MRKPSRKQQGMTVPKAKHAPNMKIGPSTISVCTNGTPPNIISIPQPRLYNACTDMAVNKGLRHNLKKKYI